MLIYLIFQIQMIQSYDQKKTNFNPTGNSEWSISRIPSPRVEVGGETRRPGPLICGSQTRNLHLLPRA